MEPWLCTDEHKETVAALEMVMESSGKVLVDRYRWKWVIIATHNAAQGFMVLALRHGNGLLALRDDNARQWLKAYEQGEKAPVERLDHFLNLFEKVKSNRMLCFVNSEYFRPKPGHNRSMKILNRIRNQFIHFVPKTWFLELTGLPQICLDCLGVVEFLGWKSGNVQWPNASQKKRTESTLQQAKSSLNAAKVRYEASTTYN